MVGLPKLDGIFQGRYADRAGFLSSRGLDTAKPTVLFAPTYKPTCMYDVKDVVFEATKDRCNLVVKLHHYSWMGKYAPHEQHRIFERRVRQYPHATLVPMEEYNIVPWMAAADTLLSEASSTVFDFLALGKTGIIYDLPGDPHFGPADALHHEPHQDPPEGRAAERGDASARNRLRGSSRPTAKARAT